MLKKLAKFFIALVVLSLVIVALHRPILKQVYKLEYKQTIDKYADYYDIDRYMVYSLIKKESRYNPLAVSKKGAMGLMQIMPETGGYIADLLGQDGFNKNDLFDAETSIKYGMYYLSKLSKDFKGDTDAILAAYNGGEGNVRKWMQENNDTLDAEKIPFIQTRNYVESINRDTNVYKYLY